jgi:hypothetical protein
MGNRDCLQRQQGLDCLHRCCRHRRRGPFDHVHADLLESLTELRIL